MFPHPAGSSITLRTTVQTDLRSAISPSKAVIMCLRLNCGLQSWHSTWTSSNKHHSNRMRTFRAWVRGKRQRWWERARERDGHKYWSHLKARLSVTIPLKSELNLSTSTQTWDRTKQKTTDKKYLYFYNFCITTVSTFSACIQYPEDLVCKPKCVLE